MRDTRVKVGLLLSLLSWLTACAEEPRRSDDGETSSVSILLQSNAPSGAVYRLRDFNVDLVGPVSITLSSESFATTAPVMSARLPSGTYTASVQDGWRLERVDAMGTFTVPAYLAQPSLDFSVRGGQTASVSFAFRTDSDFAIPGGVNVGFVVDDTAPMSWNSAWRSGTAAGVATDDMGNVYVLYQQSTSDLAVESFTSWGESRYYKSFQALSSTLPNWGIDIEVIPDGRLRVASSSTQSVVITTLDAMTGNVLEQLTYPQYALGLVVPGLTPSLSGLAVSVGRLGSVAIVSMSSGSNPDYCRVTYIADGNVFTATGYALGVRATASSSNRVRLALAGLEEHAWISFPDGTVHLRRDNASLLWSRVASAATDIAADALGNLYVLRGSGHVVRYDANGTVLWTWSLGGLSSGSRIGAGALGVALVSNLGGPLRTRVLNVNGAVTRDELLSFTMASDVPAAVALDVASGVAVAVSRTGPLGIVGRVAP